MYTLQDLVSHVLDAFDLGGEVVDVRRAKRAAIEGFEQATKRHGWQRYNEDLAIPLKAAITEGTVSINGQGVVTVTGDDWPSYVTNGDLVVEFGLYRVTERLSDTEIQIDGWPAGETETDIPLVLVFSRFRIEKDVRQVYDIHNSETHLQLQMFLPNGFLNHTTRLTQQEIDSPRLCTFVSKFIDGEVFTEIRVYPHPDRDVRLQVAYTRHPKSPKWMNDLGEVAITGAEAEKTLTTTKSFPAGEVSGARVRIAAASETPDADQSFRLTDPIYYASEGFAVARVDSTSFTVMGLPAVGDVGAMLTDPLDAPDFLLPAIRQFAEASFRRTRTSSDIVTFASQMASAENELRYAMELDSPLARLWGQRRYRIGLAVFPEIVSMG